MFEIVIQFAAILAVCWEYRAKIVTVVAGMPREKAAQRFTINLLIAFMPAAVLGLLFAQADQGVLVRARSRWRLAFIVGGVVILWAEKRKHRITCADRWTT